MLLCNEFSWLSLPISCGSSDTAEDMIRPIPSPAVIRATVYVIRLLTESFKSVYYQNWKVIQ